MNNNQKEFISFKEVEKAYFDCRVHKRNKIESLKYEINYEMNNYELWRDLNFGTYKISKSICFCVQYPKLREVFAASFRDRVVHHIIINRMMYMFENDFIDSTYSCRKGKGVIYGVNDVKRQIENIGWDAWYVKLDLSGFFMSIDKDVLWRDVKNLMERYKEGFDDNLDRWKSLVKQVIYNRCELNCEKRGRLYLWDYLPKNKSLFSSNGKGIPIGNLTSQIFANFYLTPLDKFITSQVQGYGRYVDDFVLIDKDKNKLLKLIPKIRKFLKSYGLVLNENKTIIQRCYKGLLFTGYVIKPWGVYNGGRLDYSARQLVYSTDLYNEEKILTRANSYLGFMRRTMSYKTRCFITNSVMNVHEGKLFYKGNRFSLHVKDMEEYEEIINRYKFKYIDILGQNTIILRWVVSACISDKNTLLIRTIKYRGNINKIIIENLLFRSIEKFIDETKENEFYYKGYNIKLTSHFLSELLLASNLNKPLTINHNLEIGVNELDEFKEKVYEFFELCKRCEIKLKKDINIDNYEVKIKQK